MFEKHPGIFSPVSIPLRKVSRLIGFLFHGKKDRVSIPLRKVSRQVVCASPVRRPQVSIPLRKVSREGTALFLTYPVRFPSL